MSGFKRLHVDFNTLDSEPVDLVKLAAPGTQQEHELPVLKQGERVILYDSDGLEVEATIIHDEEGWWLAAPDATTWHDVKPQAIPLPKVEAR